MSEGGRKEGKLTLSDELYPFLLFCVIIGDDVQCPLSMNNLKGWFIKCSVQHFFYHLNVVEVNGPFNSTPFLQK